MSPGVRSLFRSYRSRNKSIDAKQQEHWPDTVSAVSSGLEQFLPRYSDELDENVWIAQTDAHQSPMNISCCGGDEKKAAVKNQVKATRAVKETVTPIKAMANPMEPSDHKIVTVKQQYAPKVDVDDDLKDLFGEKDVTKAMINQLAQRALAGSMNASNDDPPRLCTKKHVSDSRC